MKIAVIGAGIVGVTSAFELAVDGHDVEVFEATSAVAQHASFATSGILAPSLSLPMSHPAWPTNSWRPFSDNTPLEWKKGMRLNDLRWLRQWKRKQPVDAFTAQLQSAYLLSQLSQQRLHDIATSERLEFERSQGMLQIVRTESQLASLQNKLRALKEFGMVFRELMPEEARKIEPAFAATEEFYRAIHFPHDEVANCRQFAILLKNRAQAMGVQMHFGMGISAIQADPHPWVSIERETAARKFDHIVVCAGAMSQQLLAHSLGKVPTGKLASYSLTAHVKESLNAPRSALFDTHSHTTVTRMGNRVRVSSGVELGSNPSKNTPHTVKRLYKAMQNYFPGAVDYASSMQLWKGPMDVTTDGLPILGATATPGLWINSGHGANGWGMACGAARCIADAIGGKPTATDIRAFNPLRF